MLSLRVVSDFTTPGITVYQALLSMEFPQARRIVEWAAISSSKAASYPGIEYASPYIGRSDSHTEPPGKPHNQLYFNLQNRKIKYK